MAQRSKHAFGPFPKDWVFSRDTRYHSTMSETEQRVQNNLLRQEINQTFTYPIVGGIEDKDNIARLSVFKQWVLDAQTCFDSFCLLPLMPPVPNGKWGTEPRKLETDIKSKALTQWQQINHSNMVPYETMLSRRPRKNQEVGDKNFVRYENKRIVEHQSGRDYYKVIVSVSSHVLGWNTEDIRVEDIKSVLKSSWKNPIVKYHDTDFPNPHKDKLFSECGVFDSFKKK